MSDVSGLNDIRDILYIIDISDINDFTVIRDFSATGPVSIYKSNIFPR